MVADVGTHQHDGVRADVHVPSDPRGRLLDR